ncbi:hypothetical protein N7541_004801 [Penicillium brevicompactum]|uniref:Uncharacterized protein n=1 Tax=Penicillium brevicompactum TaxID=5074 RepID=A0A9W9RHJ9_PENBR|nr:hypothetical protein N7541_004801 [Penicillium brevicompactum]
MHKTFPSVEHLALDMYDLGSEILTLGPNGPFNWSSLRSLELGGSEWEYASKNMKLLTGRMVNLRRLQVSRNRSDVRESCRNLENFLESFDTLVDLTMFNCFVPFDAIACHTNLINLCVHHDETWKSDAVRHVAETEDLINLDASCPYIESMELDIERVDNDWPYEVLDTLATRFPNMKTLSLHSLVGNFEDRRPYFTGGGPDSFFEPYLTYKEAKKIGSQFFEARHEVFRVSPECVEMVNGLGRFQKLTLGAGTYKGRRRYVDESFRGTEWLNTLTFKLLPPETVGEAPALVHSERDEVEKLYQSSTQDSSDKRWLNHLRWVVGIAKKGPCRVPTVNPSGEKSYYITRETRQLGPVATRRSGRLAQVQD